MHTRQQTIKALQEDPNLDVLIIGAGINGVGTFRELALHDLRVLIVDKYDYGSGASAASSHMLHGGIRYLENGEFRLVREALIERNRLLKNAPHYAKPLPTTIPIFKWFSGLFNAPLKFLNILEKPSERGAIVIKLGLILYDLFAAELRTMPRHTFTSRKKALLKHPLMSSDIVSTATYYDAYMPSPERLCLDVLFDALAANPRSYALNYCSASGTKGGEVTLTDHTTDTILSVRPRVVVNAAGPWIDFVNRALGIMSVFIGGTKGSHLMLDNEELYKATAGHEIFFENADGRIVLIFPYMGKVMIGTTDIRIEDPEEAVCTSDEADYMLALVKRVFPSIRVDRSQIIFAFSGVRPLPVSGETRTGAISRDHSIKTVDAQQSGLGFSIHSLVGGKWTTFRAFSEQVADKVMAELGISRKIGTQDMAIGGGKGFPITDKERTAYLAKLQEKTGLPLVQLSMLLDRYGTKVEQVAAYMIAGEDAPLQHLPHHSKRELAYLAQHEHVVHLDDILLRRSLIAILGGATKAAITEVANAIAPVLGWDDATQQTQMTRALTVLQQKHTVREIAS